MPSVTVNLPRTAFVSEAMPDNNFSIFPLLYTGNDPNFQNCISLLEVDLPTLPVTAVDSAILQLSVIVKSGGVPSPVVVNKVTSPFSAATVTYSTRPTFTPTSFQINITTEDLYKVIEIDMTSLVNEWLSGTSPNYGIALTDDDGSTMVQFANNNIVYEPYFPKLILTYSEAPAITGTDFAYKQLAHVIEQLIALYPTNEFTVYTRGFSAAVITGTAYELFKPSSGTFGAFFVLDDDGVKETIPLNAIAAISVGATAVYDPSITYLTPQNLIPGFDTDLLSAYHEYLPVLTEIDSYLGAVINSKGKVFKNEYGMIVLASEEGIKPIFIPVFQFNAILPPTSTTESKTQEPKIIVESKDAKNP